MPEHRLVLIGGPIASGKTTVARALAALLRSIGQDAAAIDMDEMIAIVAGEDWSLIIVSDRKKAGRLASRVVQGLFNEGVSTVAIAGSTLSPYECDEVVTHLIPDSIVTRVLLRVSVEESIRRAQRLSPS
jgi:adenylylsulfate kinase-like enzyme